MRTVAVTGGIGSGKSSVTARLRELGAITIDADALAREVVAPGTPGLAALVAAFGPEILAPDGALNRAEMAARAFGNCAALAQLEAITHPLIAEKTAALLDTARKQGAGVVIYDVPLLVERGLVTDFDAVIVVEAPLQLRLERLAARGLSHEDALARISAQATDDERRALADYVLDNSGNLAALQPQIDAVWQALAT